MSETSRSDAYRLIHSALATWVQNARTHGFDDTPIALSSGVHWCDEYMFMGKRMRERKDYTDMDMPDLT
ncbi:MAG: hypothetical protein AAGB05_08060 [Pseudomonadota bacterium]